MSASLVFDTLDVADGVYFVIKDVNSTILYVNENFARLVGQKKEQLIGFKDTRAEHVAHDVAVIKSGKPLLNLHETIQVPGRGDVPIVTQKGLLREKGTGKIIGITVCFSLDEEQKLAPYWINRLKMQPSPVGGWFAAAAHSDEPLLHASLPERFKGDRRFYSSNYFLLDGDQVLALHSLNQDELWFHHTGFAIRLHIFSLGELEGAQPNYTCVTLQREQQLQYAVPHNTWFGAELLDRGFALVGCSLSPSWDQRDSLSPTTEVVAALKKQFPAQGAIIERLAHTPHKSV